MLKGQKIYSLLIFCIFLRSVKTDCSSPDMTENEFKYGYSNPDHLSLLHEGEIKTFRINNAKRIIEKTNNQYIDAKLENENLIIFTTDAFKNYAKEQTQTKIQLNLDIECDPTSNTVHLSFLQQLKKDNYFDPEFPQTEYQFSVPLPLYKGIDLTTFQDIFAKDYDIYDNRITFTSSDSSLIDVGTKSKIGPDQKTYYASLKLEKPLLNIKDTIKFTITAKDSGIPSRSAKASVTITADPTNVLAQDPQFEKILYEGNLDESLKLHIENVILEKSTYSNDVQFAKAEGDDSNLFTISTTNQNEIQIKLAKDLTENDIKGKNILKFILIATNPRASSDARAAIVIKVPNETTPNQKPSIFRKEYAILTTKSDYIGSIMKFSDFLTESSASAKLEYSLEITEDYLKNRLQIDNSSDLKINQALKSGIYSFNLIAKNQETEESGKTEVNLVVENNEHNPKDDTDGASTLTYSKILLALIIAYVMSLFNFI